MADRVTGGAVEPSTSGAPQERGVAGASPAADRVTIGMPVFNNEPTIRRALDSLVSQTFVRFRLVISDDGSTDATASICDEYARRDARVTVIRQPKNLNYGNFRFVLAQAQTSFFMFAAGDDYWDRHYLARMIEALEQNPAAVCAVSRVAFVRNGECVRNASGTEPLVSDADRNIVAFLNVHNDNSRMYGLFRTDVAKRAFPKADFFAYDWAFSAGTLRDGIHVEVPEVLLWRDYTEPQRYIEYVRRDAKSIVSRLFPMAPFTRDLLRRLRFRLTRALARELFVLNLRFHVTYLSRYHPSAASAIWRRLVGHVIRSAVSVRTSNP